MGLRQREWAARARRELRRKLGMACKQCGSRYYAKLEFDVINPCDNGKHHKIEWSWRISFYRQQADAGNLQLLCPDCHNRKTYKDNYDADYCANN